MKSNQLSIDFVQTASDIIGNKWTAQILYVLSKEDCSQSFCDLQEDAGGINPRTLSARLSMLEEKNIIERVYHNNTSRCEYALSKRGAELIPIITAMAQWGERNS